MVRLRIPDSILQILKQIGFWLSRHEPLSLIVSAVLLAVGGSILPTSLMAGFGLIVLGALLPALAVYWKRQDDVLDDTAEAREKLLEEALHPLLERAASVVSMPRHLREGAADRAAENAVKDLCHSLATVPGVRTVAFAISDDGQRMVPLYTAGRNTRPGDFVKGTLRGDKAFKVLGGPDPYVFVGDLDKAELDEWAGTGDGYRTFITAPIRSFNEGYGLLTIDAPVTGTLDKRHAATAALFAAALGVLFAEAARGQSRQVS